MRNCNVASAARGIIQCRGVSLPAPHVRVLLSAHGAFRGRAAQRGFELPEETLRYLQRRLPRDMRSMCELLDALDDAALAAQRRLTIPFIREVIGDR